MGRERGGVASFCEEGKQRCEEVRGCGDLLTFFSFHFVLLFSYCYLGVLRFFFSGFGVFVIVFAIENSSFVLVNCL